MINKSILQKLGIGIIAQAFFLVGITTAPEVSTNNVHDLFNKSYNIASKVRPKSVDQLKEIVKSASKNNQKISILGAGKSTGGQTYAPNTIQVDMSRLNRIISINKTEKLITVESGITWKQIQEVLDPLGLSVIAMQSYCDFSVGGSASVNVHGQEHSFGSLIKTIETFQLLQADGTIITCSRKENPELFSCAIGGYGLFGIITQVTLRLTKNCSVMRESRIDEAKDIFSLSESLLKEPDIQFFSSRLLVDPSNLYKKTFTIIYREYPAIKPEKLKDLSSLKISMEKKFFNLLRTTPMIKKFRFFFGKMYFERTGTIFSRNNIMHSSIKSLKWNNPASRDILQEYFIPSEHCAIFLEQARDILDKYNVNILNTTIRYVSKESESVLSYARENCFSFVLYAHIENNDESYTKTQSWTRELIEAALASNGSFYLPYQHLATREQLVKAYPQWQKFIMLKQQYDPQELFINELYLRYK